MQLDLVDECPALIELVGDDYYRGCKQTSLPPLNVCDFLINGAQKWIKQLERFRDLLIQESREHGTKMQIVVEMGIIHLEGDLSDQLVRQLEEEELAYPLEELEPGSDEQL